ncbi:GAF and HD-GYP domain-containing protein [Oleispirillum naphthae]|uniref:GAF and HD-GYP domain-containing protein n=1 Tax=Oleispirillum naphthae TaxID=2838853 RepID=UPI0030822FB5
MDRTFSGSPAEEPLLCRLVELGIALSSERDRNRLLETLLLEAKSLTNADGGTLYLMSDDDTLCFEIIRNDTLAIAMGGTTGRPIDFPCVRLSDPESGKPNHKNVASHAALAKEIVVIDDAYHAEGFDFAGTRAFDARTGYRSTSFMTVPLMTPGGEVVGVLQLINARDEKGAVVPFGEAVKPIIAALASQAAIAIDNRQLLDAQRALLDSFIKLIAGAIDEKSPYTGGHCQRVPEITNMIAKAAVEQTEGPFADFTLDEDAWYALHLAGWLHDCGKVTTPEYVVDKSTKLETICDRLHEVRTRFEVLRRDAEIRCLERKLAGENAAAAEAALAAEIAALESDYAFVAECNLGGEFMADDRIARLKEIGARTFTRTFDRTIGLSWEETNRVKAAPELCATPGTEHLLADRADHKTGHYDLGELYNLAVRRGTLTDEERAKINDHIVVTIRMLKELPFPKKLRDVPEFAGGHHEKINGTGYPNGLTGDQMSVPARIMAIADIFEALTAADRPYKTPKPLSEAVKIMSFMKKDGHIDPQLFDLFLSSGVYRRYAEQYLRPEQVDAVDIGKYLG